MPNDHSDIHRRELPPLPALASFLAAVETSSFSRAAQRMALTQSAISRQIALLEDWLGVPLFERRGRRVTPTPAALAYAEAVGPAVERLRSATRRLLTPVADRALTIATLPSFGMRWLAPRLPGLTARHPELLVNFAARSYPFDFAEERFDAAIHFGLPDWPGADHALLFHEDVVAVCSPDWLARHPVARPADLLPHTLLSLEARPDAWARWFAAAGVADAAIREGPVYEHFLMLAHAAAAGMGMALIPSFLIRPELASGALVTPINVTLSASEAYYLVWPRRSSHSPLFDRFRHWLLDEARAEA
ncbi:LysR substrate-binding domain-containing protein [Sphingomonas sanguinis]|jgi:LysR family glycine cleavage system transcriptional activator|uniref:LysR family transcriptional regulator n=1 Tax=Sphingomonas sanguinis TaxID=33051 RepID=A0A7Y7QX79_9SPHN|nr:LysR substrate-binding domain-containing protein [Sphingomonas sanguinis]MBZ6382400.1 LysR family transcriptional regulator [Sphingomonas sanguinis]NNG50591.1 LysR family transcriptional regulator [Sphingomonas sanguinis]NNG54669.1 LysR family transcriptional regulator [Sphingomonas sanguinis]NVP31698.1 LysR family transcriptional regulator [Sphingomonas sanguinis]